jgi:hypothetical protein
VLCKQRKKRGEGRIGRRSEPLLTVGNVGADVVVVNPDVAVDSTPLLRGVFELGTGDEALPGFGVALHKEERMGQ